MVKLMKREPVYGPKLDFNYVRTKMRHALESITPSEIRHGKTPTTRNRDHVISIANTTSNALRQEDFPIRLYVPAKTGGRISPGPLSALVIINHDNETVTSLKLVVTATRAQINGGPVIALNDDGGGLDFFDEMFRVIEAVACGEIR